jgi:hypothetical protein
VTSGCPVPEAWILYCSYADRELAPRHPLVLRFPSHTLFIQLIFADWYCRKSICFLNTRISPVALNTGYAHCLKYPVNSPGPLFSDVECNTASHLGHYSLIRFKTIESSCLTTVQGRRCGMMKPALSADLLYSIRCYQSGVTLNVHLTYNSNNQIISGKNGQYS